VGGLIRFDGRSYLEFLIPGLIAMSSMTHAFGIRTDINWPASTGSSSRNSRPRDQQSGLCHREVLAGMTRP
jgi:hypothetical protein